MGIQIFKCEAIQRLLKRVISEGYLFAVLRLYLAFNGTLVVSGTLKNIYILVSEKEIASMRENH